MRRTVMILILVGSGLFAVPEATAVMPDRLPAIVQRVAQLNAAAASRVAVVERLEGEFPVRVVNPAVPVARLAAPAAEDVYVEPPMLIFDRQTGKQYVFTSMRWRDCGRNPCWARDSGTNGAGDHGGPDGFAVRIERTISVRSHYMMLNDRCGTRIQLTRADFFSSHGVGFAHQDTEGDAPRKCAKGTYNWDGASMGVEFVFNDGKGGGECIDREYSLGAEYFHTWETVSVNGIGIGDKSFDVSWADKPHKFRAPAAPAPVKAC